MRYLKKDISHIQFTYTSYTEELKNSILRIGFSFPIHVILKEKQYICIDGHKRLSVLKDILKDDPQYHRGSQVYILIKNGDYSRSHDCWNGRNTH